MTRLAIVTGANKGIGFAITSNLCQQFDGDVILCSRSLERGQKAVDSLKEKGLNPILHQLDIDDTKSIQTLKDFILKNYGGIDVLVNNAAIAYPVASTVPFLKQAQDTIKTNFFSLLNVCEILFPLLRPHARVVNLSSSAGMLSKVGDSNLKKKFSSPNLTIEELCNMLRDYLDDVNKGIHLNKGWPKTAYNTSKVAVSALTFIQQRQFDSDSREDLVVNAVHPGYVDTDMSSHKGPLTIEEGADAPTYLALLPPNVNEPKGQMVWCDRKVVPWDQ